MVGEGVKWEATESLMMFMIGSGVVGLSSLTSIFLGKIFFSADGVFSSSKKLNLKVNWFTDVLLVGHG